MSAAREGRQSGGGQGLLRESGTLTLEEIKRQMSSDMESTLKIGCRIED
jgi:hypothetical protein